MSDGGASETKAEILEATHRALVEHGYADLSMAKIAAEYDGSQSLLHYHFDTKERLIAAYVRQRRQNLESEAASLPDDPRERLDALLSLFVDLEPYDGSSGLMPAIIEMYGVADGTGELQAELRATDELARDLFRTTIEDGQEAGAFTDVDAEAVTWLLFAVHESAFIRELVDEDTTALKEALEQVVLAEVRR